MVSSISVITAGCIVTIDTIECQTAIAEQIVDQDAEYVLAINAAML
jgi:predicted transposase YbfD/YdcC